MTVGLGGRLEKEQPQLPMIPAVTCHTATGEAVVYPLNGFYSRVIAPKICILHLYIFSIYFCFFFLQGTIEVLILWNISLLGVNFLKIAAPAQYSLILCPQIAYNPFPTLYLNLLRLLFRFA